MESYLKSITETHLPQLLHFKTDQMEKNHLIWFSSLEESGFSKNSHWPHDAIFHWPAAEMIF